MDKLEEIANLLTMHQKTLAVAESCTGGLLSNLITEMPGCSIYYQGGVIAYSNIAKIEVVGVPQECLRNHGSVSERTALAMADGVREALSADIGIAITGIAGPGGGTDEKPVGLVHMAITDLDNQEVKQFNFKGSRSEIKRLAVEEAINLCLKFLEEFYQ